jgi:hypothetical protein
LTLTSAPRDRSSLVRGAKERTLVVAVQNNGQYSKTRNAGREAVCRAAESGST